MMYAMSRSVLSPTPALPTLVAAAWLAPITFLQDSLSIPVRPVQ